MILIRVEIPERKLERKKTNSDEMKMLANKEYLRP